MSWRSTNTAADIGRGIPCRLPAQARVISGIAIRYLLIIILTSILCIVNEKVQIFGISINAKSGQISMKLYGRIFYGLAGLPQEFLPRNHTQDHGTTRLPTYLHLKVSDENVYLSGNDNLPLGTRAHQQRLLLSQLAELSLHAQVQKAVSSCQRRVHSLVRLLGRRLRVTKGLEHNPFSLI